MFKTLIDPSSLRPKLHDPDWVVVDCRFDLTNPAKGEELYREAHIPGARYAHLDRHLSGMKTGKNGRHPLPDIDRMIRNFSDLGISPGMQVVAYDADTGMYAARLWWMLRWVGHDSVAVLDGVDVVVMLSSMLHSIGVGNMLGSWVKVICVDINPAVVTKLSDRGSSQTIGIVTDVGLFLHQLAEQLKS